MSEFHQKHKHHIRLWITLVVITLISAYFAFFYSPNHVGAPTVTLSTSTPSQATSTVSLATTSTKQVLKAQTQKINKIEPVVYTSVDKSTINDQQSTTTQTLAQNLILTTLTVGDKSYQANIPVRSTAYAAMQELAKTTALTFSGKMYGDLGFFVEEINGVKNDRQKQLYWIYYVNGKKATLGVSSYIIEPNDVIMWKYETSND